MRTLKVILVVVKGNICWRWSVLNSFYSSKLTFFLPRIPLSQDSHHVSKKLLTATLEVRTNAVNLARMADDTKKTEIRLGATERANGVREEKSLNR